MTALVYTASTLNVGPSAFLGLGSSLIYALMSAISTALSVALIGIVFAFVYRSLPNVRVEWKDATFGALVALALFELAKHSFFWFVSLATNQNVV